MAYSLTLGAIAFFLAVIWGRPLINLLVRNRIGKQIRIEGPTTHQVKTGTPTMGGLMILIPVIVITSALTIANLLGWNIIGRSVLVRMTVLLLFGLLGAVDDLEGVRGRRSKGEGILGRWKALAQIILATLVVLFLHFVLDLRSVAVPGDWPVVHSGGGVHRGGLFQRRQPDRRAGRAGRQPGGQRLHLLWRHRILAAAGVAGGLLFHAGGRHHGLSVFQCAPR